MWFFVYNMGLTCVGASLILGLHSAGLVLINVGRALVIGDVDVAGRT